MDPTPTCCCRILSCKVALPPIEAHIWKACLQHLQEVCTGMKRMCANDGSPPHDSIQLPPCSHLHIHQGELSSPICSRTPSSTGKENTPLTLAVASKDMSDRHQTCIEVCFWPSFIYFLLWRYRHLFFVTYSSYKI